MELRQRISSSRPGHSVTRHNMEGILRIFTREHACQAPTGRNGRPIDSNENWLLYSTVSTIELNCSMVRTINSYIVPARLTQSIPIFD